MNEPIFISHAQSDRKVADAVCKALEDRGIRCWIATRDVAPGENFGDAIARVIRASRVMVLVFSQRANSSEEIKKEVVLASRCRVAVIPLRVEEVEPRGAFEYELLTRQWIDLFAGWDQAMARLVRQVDQIAGDGTSDAASVLPGVAVRRVPASSRRWLVPAVAAAAVIVAAGAFGVVRLAGNQAALGSTGGLQSFPSAQTQPDPQGEAAARLAAEVQRRQAEAAQQQQTEQDRARRQARADEAARQAQQDASTVQALVGDWSFAGERSCRTHAGTISVVGDTITFTWRDGGRTNIAVERVVSVAGNTIATVVVSDDATVNNELGQRMRYVVTSTTWTSVNQRSVSAVHQRC